MMRNVKFLGSETEAPSVFFFFFFFSDKKLKILIDSEILCVDLEKLKLNVVV